MKLIRFGTILLFSLLLVFSSCKEEDDVYNVEISDATEVTASSASVTVYITNALKRDGSSFGVMYSKDKNNVTRGKTIGTSEMKNQQTFSLSSLDANTTYYYIGVATIKGQQYATHTTKSFITKTDSEQ